MTAITEKNMQAKPRSSDTWLIEEGGKGAGRFIGRITPSGARLFYFRYTSSTGQRVRLPIGPYDQKGDGEFAFTVAQARDRARDLSALHRSGVKDVQEHIDYNQKTRVLEERARALAIQAESEAAELAQARRLSFRKVFDQWCSTELQPIRRPDGRQSGRKDGGAYVRAQFERHVFPTLGDKPIAEIRKADLVAVIDAQKSAGKLRTAAVLLSDLRQLMSFALDRELVVSDPLAAVKKAKLVGTPVERNRVLSESELRLLIKLLPEANMPPRSVEAIWVLLATAVRIGELSGAVWSTSLPDGDLEVTQRIQALQEQVGQEGGTKVGYVDIDARQWHLPNTKNGRPHIIHLSTFAVRHLKILQSMREPVSGIGSELSPWVFPGQDRLLPLNEKTIGKQLADRQRGEDKRLKGRSLRTSSLALPGGRWTAHDLRRTAATIMAMQGVSGEVIDEALNHINQNRMSRTYIRERRLQEQAEAFEKLGQYLDALFKLPKSASKKTSAAKRKQP